MEQETPDLTKQGCASESSVNAVRTQREVSIPTFTTERLILRAFNEHDVSPLHQILGQKGVLQYFPNPNLPTREQVERLISAQLDHWIEHGYGWWAVELRAPKTFIGWSGLQYLPETKEVEIAYLLGKPHWGKGLATEGARVGMSFGLERLGLKRIVAIVHPENIASQRVIEKLGMAFVNQTTYFGMDCYLYEIHRHLAR